MPHTFFWPFIISLLFFIPSCKQKENEICLQENFLFVKNLMIGDVFPVEDAFLRKNKDFQYEIFFQNSVVTSTEERLPDELISQIAMLPNDGQEMPSSVHVDKELYHFFSSVINSDVDMEALAMTLGTPFVARPVYDLDVMSGLMEYFWLLPGQYVLGVVTKDSIPIEKLLIKGAIPSVWR